MSERLPTPDDWSAAARAGAEARVSTTPGAPRAIGDASLPATLLQEVIDAARDAVPNEAVGLLVGPTPAAAGGRPTRYVRLINAAASPYRYLLDPQEQLQQMLEIEDGGEVIWGIVHSHVASAAVPSASDIGLAFYPDCLYVICSLAGELPEVRAWSIVGGDAHEVPLAVA